MNHNDVFIELDKKGLLEYGSFIPGELLRELAGIDIPKIGTMSDFKEASLKELGVSDYIRAQLIKKGKYLAAVKGNYKVLMPSENEEQVRSYMKSADSKLKRAIRLHDNTPRDFSNSKTKLRLHAKSQYLIENKKTREFLEK